VWSSCLVAPHEIARLRPVSGHASISTDVIDAVTEHKNPEAFSEHFRPHLWPMPETPLEAFKLLLFLRLAEGKKRDTPGPSWLRSQQPFKLTPEDDTYGYQPTTFRPDGEKALVHLRKAVVLFGTKDDRRRPRRNPLLGPHRRPRTRRIEQIGAECSITHVLNSSTHVSSMLCVTGTSPSRPGRPPSWTGPPSQPAP
jgi:hypothetical protein